METRKDEEHDDDDNDQNNTRAASVCSCVARIRFQIDG